MKFCPNCGEQLNDEDVFCPNCGSKLDAPSTPTPAANMGAMGSSPVGAAMAGASNAATGSTNTQSTGFAPNTNPGAQPGLALDAPKKPFPKVPVIIGGAVAAVAIVGAIVCASALNTPAAKFLKPQEKAFENKIADPLANSAKKYKNGLSTDITLTAEVSGLDSDIEKLFDGSSITMKVDSNQKESTANAIININGSDIITSQAYSDQKTLSFAIPEADDNVYYMDIEKMNELLDMDNTNYQDIQEKMPTEKEIARVAARYYKIASKSINKKNLTVRKEKKFSLPAIREREALTVMTWEPSREDIKDMLYDIADQVEKDKDIQNWLDDYDELAKIMSETTDDYATASITDTKDLADQIRDAADDALAGSGDLGFVWTVGVAGGEAQYINIAVDNVTIFDYETYTDKKETTDVFYLVDVFDITNKYEKDGKTYDGKISANLEGELPVYLEYKDLNPNKTDVFGIPYAQYSINGMFDVDVEDAKKGTDHKMSLNTGYYGNWDINLNTTDKSSAVKPKGKKVDISDYSEAELEELGEELYGNLSSSLEEIVADNPELGYLLGDF